jgi:hypothetical protein
VRDGTFLCAVMGNSVHTASTPEPVHDAVEPGVLIHASPLNPSVEAFPVCGPIIPELHGGLYEEEHEAGYVQPEDDAACP